MLIPLSVDVPMWRRPWVNYVIIATIVIVSITCFYDFDLFLKLAGIKVTYFGLLSEKVSVELSTEELPLHVLAVTNTLLHGGWIHLIGNMWFLWVFGNAVNYKFGHLGYLVLYMGAGFAGSMAHYASSDLPVVGASGAIFGVMGAFLVFFPQNNIEMAFVIWILRPIATRFTVSSMWMLIFWVAWNVLFLVMGSETNVALWGHLGGFTAGFGVALLCAAAGWIKPTQDERTLLQLFSSRR